MLQPRWCQYISHRTRLFRSLFPGVMSLSTGKRKSSLVAGAVRRCSRARTQGEMPNIISPSLERTVRCTKKTDKVLHGNASLNQNQQVTHITISGPTLTGVESMQGHPRTCREILSRLSSDEWERGGNPMPYKYLAKVMENTKNIIFIGKIGEEVCSIFAFMHSGYRENDATVTLLWTKQIHRRKGFSTRVMHQGIKILVNDSSYMMSGTNPTEDSRRLFESPSWDQFDWVCRWIEKASKDSRGESSSKEHWA